MYKVVVYTDISYKYLNVFKTVLNLSARMSSKREVWTAHQHGGTSKPKNEAWGRSGVFRVAAQPAQASEEEAEGSERPPTGSGGGRRGAGHADPGRPAEDLRVERVAAGAGVRRSRLALNLCGQRHRNSGSIGAALRPGRCTCKCGIFIDILRLSSSLSSSEYHRPQGYFVYVLRVRPFLPPHVVRAA